jgi:altronate dehydratase large subunit
LACCADGSADGDPINQLFGDRDLAMSALDSVAPTFLGYPRASGRVGTRNHVLVIPSTPLVNRVCQIVQARRPEAISVTHQGGSPGGDPDLLVGTLTRFAASPNVSTAIVVGIGDSEDQLDRIVDGVHDLGGNARRIALLEERGLEQTVLSIVEQFDLDQAAARLQARVPCSASDLVLGTECGGSDGYSGLTANPVIGVCSDMLIASGGSTILAEFTELIGAEHVLLPRAASRELGDRLSAAIHAWEEFALAFGEDLSGQNIMPGNVAGGITTIEEKSLGCVRKGGGSTIVDVVGFGERSSERGLILMDTDGDDVAQLVALASGGANVIAFSTGRGTPVGCPIVPTVKLSSNSPLAARMPHLIDFDAGTALSSNETITSLGERLFEMVVETANGRPTKAELHAQRDFALPPTMASA